MNLIGIYFLVTVAHQTTAGFPYSLVQLTQISFKGFISCLGEACFIMKRLCECTLQVSTDKRVPAFPPLHMTELWVACVTPSLGVFGVLRSVCCLL